MKKNNSEFELLATAANYIKWKSGIYKFQQIQDQNYEFGIFLDLSPFQAHCWVINKDILKKYVIGYM